MADTQKQNYQYFSGLVTQVTPVEYEKDGQKKMRWTVLVTDNETKQSFTSAIFDPSKFNKTPETITQIQGTEVNGSYLVDEQGKMKVYVFPKKEINFVPKPNFLKEAILNQNLYSVKLDKVEFFQGKESGNIFVKYTLNADSINLLPSEIQIQTIIDTMGEAMGITTKEQAVEQLSKGLKSKKTKFGEYDWSIIQQISSIGPNKNGKIVQPIKLSDGRLFDPIAVAQKNLVGLIQKQHNSTNETKVKQDTILADLTNLINNQDIGALKALVEPLKGLEAFLQVKNPKNKEFKQQNSSLKAYQPQKR